MGKSKGTVSAEIPQGTRDRILIESALTFIEHGYEAASLDEIAARVGLHKATLYHYVRSKDEILYECLKRSFEGYEPVLETVSDRSIAPLTRLRAFFEHFAQIQSNVFGKCLAMVGAQPLQHETGGRIRAIQRDFDHIVRGLIAEGIADGSIRELRPATVSAMLFGAFSWIPRWYDPAGPLSVSDVAQRMLDIFEFGIACDRSGWKRPAADVVPPAMLTDHDSLGADSSQLDHIVRQAAVLFAAKDYDATSLNEIAAAVGLNKATLYHYVKGKDELLYLCLKKSFENVDEVIAYLRDQGISATLRLETFHDLLLHAQNNVYGRCLNLVSPQALRGRSSGKIKDFQRRLDDAVRLFYADGVRSGEFRQVEPILFTAMLYGASNWVPRWFKPSQPGGLQHVIDTFFGIFMQGVSTRER